MIQKLTEDQINENTKNNKFKIYGADWCGFCNKAKRLMEERGIDHEYIHVTDERNMKKLKELVPEAKTIPQIFTTNSEGEEHQHVGGYTEFKNIVDKEV